MKLIWHLINTIPQHTNCQLNSFDNVLTSNQNCNCQLHSFENCNCHLKLCLPHTRIVTPIWHMLTLIWHSFDTHLIYSFDTYLTFIWHSFNLKLELYPSITLIWHCLHNSQHGLSKLSFECFSLYEYLSRVNRKSTLPFNEFQSLPAAA